MINRRFVFMLLAVVLLIMPSAVYAQEVTPEPAPTMEPTTTPPVETVPLPDGSSVVNNGVLALIGVIVLLFAGTVVFLGIKLFDSAPPWVQSLIRQNAEWAAARVDAAFDALERKAAATPDPLDDVKIAELRKAIEADILAKLLAHIQASGNGVVIAPNMKVGTTNPITGETEKSVFG